MDKYGGVEFSHSDAGTDPLPRFGQEDLEDLVVGLALPDVLHGLPQVLVGLVQPALHLDVQGCADQGKQGRLELDGAVVIEGHVHGHQPRDDDDDDYGVMVIYIYYDEVCVCLLRKIIISSWESPVTTQVGFS